MEPELDVDCLIGLMPDTVREEYLAHGDASIFGFSPGVAHWLKTSEHRRIIKWRDDLRTFTINRLNAARKRQDVINGLFKDLPKGNGSIRHRAVIDPELKGFMEMTDGRTAWSDPDAIRDTEKQAPKLFGK